MPSPNIPNRELRSLGFGRVEVEVCGQEPSPQNGRNGNGNGHGRGFFVVGFPLFGEKYPSK